MATRSNARVMWRMLGLAKPLAGWMVLAVACGVAGFCCAMGVPVLAAEAALAAVGAGSLPWTLGTTVAVLAVMAVARGVLHYVEQRCNHYIAFKLLAHVRDLVFGALRRLTPAKLAGSDSGALISTVTADVELLEVFYAHTISPICIAVLMAAVMGVFLGGVHPALAALALASYALVGIVVPVAVSRASGGEGRHSRDLAAGLSGFVLDGLRGLGEVLQYGAGASRLEELDGRSEELVASQRKLRARGAAGQAATTGAIMVLSCAQMLLAAWLAGAGAVSAEGAVLATVATFSSFGPFVALANLGSTLQGTLAAGNRVLDILDEEPLVAEVPDSEGARPGFDGIAAEDVSFSYAGGASADGASASGEKILDHVSVAVEPGQIVGIQGKSGSGKSTLCRLLMRFWDVDRGALPSRALTCVRLPRAPCATPRPSWSRTLTSFTTAFATTCSSRGRTPQARSLRWRAARRASTTSSAACPTGTTPWSASWAIPSPAASASAWGWPGPSCTTRRCSCWTSPRATWTPSTRPRS